MVCVVCGVWCVCVVCGVCVCEDGRREHAVWEGVAGESATAAVVAGENLAAGRGSAFGTHGCAAQAFSGAEQVHDDELFGDGGQVPCTSFCMCAFFAMRFALLGGGRETGEVRRGGGGQVSAVRAHRQWNQAVYGAWGGVREHLERDFGLRVHKDVCAFFETPVCTHIFHLGRKFAGVRLCIDERVETLDGVAGAFARFYGYAVDGGDDVWYLLHVRPGGKYSVMVQVGSVLTRENVFHAADSLEEFMCRMEADQNLSDGGVGGSQSVEGGEALRRVYASNCAAAMGAQWFDAEFSKWMTVRYLKGACFFAGVLRVYAPRMNRRVKQGLLCMRGRRR